jgi:hypothetical protein
MFNLRRPTGRSLAAIVCAGTPRRLDRGQARRIRRKGNPQRERGSIDHWPAVAAIDGPGIRWLIAAVHGGGIVVRPRGIRSMNDPAPAMSRPLRAILVGGGIAATLDILYACVRSAGHGRSPEWVLQSVASGLLGNAAFDSGPAGAALGLACHYAILFVAAAVYRLASQRVLALRARPVTCGALFGVAVYLFMNFVVLPLSAFPFHLSYPALRLLEGFASHALFVGVPIALSVRWLAGSAREPAGQRVN